MAKPTDYDILQFCVRCIDDNYDGVRTAYAILSGKSRVLSYPLYRTQWKRLKCAAAAAIAEYRRKNVTGHYGPI